MKPPDLGPWDPFQSERLGLRPRRGSSSRRGGSSTARPDHPLARAGQRAFQWRRVGTVQMTRGGRGTAGVGAGVQGGREPRAGL